VVSATESLRKASAVLRLHHNSVAYRVGIAEEALGYSVTDPYGRFRVLLTLVFLRLRGQHETR
jgi:DNA-binding PucR family transcriptional regulator